MKTPLHDPARAPSGQFIDRNRRSSSVRTVVDGQPLPSPAAGAHDDRIKLRIVPKSRYVSKTTRIGATTVFRGTIKGGERRTIGGAKGIRLRKLKWIVAWRSANDVARQPMAADHPDTARLTGAEQVILQQALLRLADLPPGFTDDLFNAPPFPAGYPEILGGG